MSKNEEYCGICMDKYTSILRKKCVCKYCKADTCSKCIERYLLDKHEDAHCLHCRVNYNDITLHEICTKTYLQHTYFKHRQEVLVNRERANLPGLQEIAIIERKKRDNDDKIMAIRAEIVPIEKERDIVALEYRNYDDKTDELRLKLDDKMDSYRMLINSKRREIQDIKNSMSNPEDDEKYEKKKFIRRCTINNCQGFLSTAWKCGICEYYSCSKCFKPKSKKYDDPHECLKDDIDTAELIKKDCKPCPNCGEFIMKSSGCDQMWCLSCKTPWSWTTGKVVLSGPIHNPHYYEWMKRNGSTPRNPADIPCGGYPDVWDLRKIPKYVKNSHIFYEFHRICGELQEISERNYRSHIDNTTNGINVKFLLGDFDEKRWGQHLAKNERKRKRDNEVQEIFAAFRMVAVELINRVQNYDGRFASLPPKEIEQFLEMLYIEIKALIDMINDGFKCISISYSYSVPFIYNNKQYYNVQTINFSNTKLSSSSHMKSDTIEADTIQADTIQADTIEADNIQMNEHMQIQHAIEESFKHV